MKWQQKQNQDLEQEQQKQALTLSNDPSPNTMRGTDDSGEKGIEGIIFQVKEERFSY